MPVTVLVTHGSDAVLRGPDRGAEPERVDSAFVSAQTGIAVEDLPGKTLTALVDDAGNLAGFERA